LSGAVVLPLWDKLSRTRADDGERGVSVDHSTIYRWVQKYAPEIEKRLRWEWRGPLSISWRVDETCVKIRGKWTCL
jgi:transposase-like protein